MLGMPHWHGEGFQESQVLDEQALVREEKVEDDVTFLR